MISFLGYGNPLSIGLWLASTNSSTQCHVASDHIGNCNHLLKERTYYINLVEDLVVVPFHGERLILRDREVYAW